MNEDPLKPQIETVPTETAEHPLHMLDNQADPETKPKVVLQKPIRTYESDIAEVLARKKTSMMTMAIAEDQKKKSEPAPEPPKKYGKKTFMFVLSILLVLVGLGGGYYLYLQSPIAPVDIQRPVIRIPSIVTPDSQKVVPVGNMTKAQLIQYLQGIISGESIESQKMTEFVLSKNTGSTTIRVTGSEFLTALNFDMPDTLKRSLLDKWMLGVYGAEEEKLPFVIFTTDFFQNAYAGMLKWETSMPDELADLLNYKNGIVQDNSTGTTSITSYFNIKGKFEDRTVLNRDVREFRTDYGQLLVLYSFIDKDTLVIATSEATLRGIIEKIEKQTYVR